MTSILDSRYRIEEKIGSGGMGEVYKAFDMRLNIPVAVKVTTPQNSDVAVAFYREAEILSNLSHPSLPRVTDFNRINEKQYLVMEYIDGDDLKTLFEKRKTPFTPDEVSNWAIQLFSVIGYLHSQGIQHRDIKPSNIKVRGNQVFLLDFGIAYGQVGEMSTFSSNIFPWQSGTREYASLEQLKGAKTTNASDLYSLAATLYYLLTGKTPENPETRIQMLALKKTDPLKSLRLLVPALKKNAANAIMAALELDVNRRPQSAAQMCRMMFPQKAAPSKSSFLRKTAVAAGLLLLLLSGVFLGANVQRFSAAFNKSQVVPETKVPSPQEQATALTAEALTLLQSAKYDDSLKKCEEALSKDPNYAYAYFVCGDNLWDDVYYDVESFAEMSRVQKNADKILSLVVSPQTPEEFVARAWANLAKEKYDIAIADANKALELKPDFVAALMIRASARSSIPDENNKEILNAFNDYDRVVQLMPNYVQARANRANSYFDLGKYEWAISDYTEAIRILGAPRYFYGRGNCYYALGKYREARAEYQEALKLDPKYLSSQLNLAESYMQEEDWNNAVKQYTKTISIKPNFPAFRNRGYAGSQMRQFDKAIKDFNQALEFDDTDYLTYFYRGLAFAGKDNFQKAVSDFSEAIDKSPNDDRKNLAGLYRYRAAAYRRLEQEEKANSDEKKARTLDG